jgi:hypothetical protein
VVQAVVALVEMETMPLEIVLLPEQPTGVAVVAVAVTTKTALQAVRVLSSSNILILSPSLSVQV